MSYIKEINISSVGEPAHIKLEKNSKGYNYEISLYGDDCETVLTQIFEARTRLEKQLAGINSIPGA